MQLSSGTHIPDGLLAAMTLRNENSRLGVPTKNPALHQGIDASKSQTAMGLQTLTTTARVRSRCTGKERDTESGLDDFGPRYYASTMGRFMSPDDVGGHLEDPQTLNLYSYVGNNPLSRTDPSGHDFYQSCAQQSSTCGNQAIGKDVNGNNVNQLVSGTTDANGKFSGTVVTSASLSDANSGNTAAVNGSGVQITTGTGTSSQQTGQGIFIANTPAANIQGQGAGWNQFSFHIDSNDIAHGVLSSGEATYNGAGGHQGMMDTLNSMKAGGNGPWQYPGEDHYNPYHPGDHNMRFSTGDHPVFFDYGPSPHFPVPSSGTMVPRFHIDNGTGPLHLNCAVTGGTCF
jgi:RHS repeat-associated protein